jgi:hypothetical protein
MCLLVLCVSAYHPSSLLGYICVLILLHMCPHTIIYVSSDTTYVSAYYYICVRILLNMCPHTYYYMWPHTTTYVSSYHASLPLGYICVICVRIPSLLALGIYMCPHTTAIYVSSYYYMCVLILLCKRSLLLHMCPHTTTQVSSPTTYVPSYYDVSSYYCRSVLSTTIYTIYVSAYYYIYVSAYYYIYVSSYHPSSLLGSAFESSVFHISSVDCQQKVISKVVQSSSKLVKKNVVGFREFSLPHFISRLSAKSHQ